MNGASSPVSPSQVFDSDLRCPMYIWPANNHQLVLTKDEPWAPVCALRSPRRNHPGQFWVRMLDKSIRLHYDLSYALVTSNTYRKRRPGPCWNGQALLCVNTRTDDQITKWDLSFRMIRVSACLTFGWIIQPVNCNRYCASLRFQGARDLHMWEYNADRPYHENQLWCFSGQYDEKYGAVLDLAFDRGCEIHVAHSIAVIDIEKRCGGDTRSDTIRFEEIYAKFASVEDC